MQLLIDKHLLFHEFVLKKIKKLHSDKIVDRFCDSICIKSRRFLWVLKFILHGKILKLKKPNIKDELERCNKINKKR